MITKLIPHPCLNKTIDYYWIEKEKTSNVKILPDGSTCILMNMGGPINITNENTQYLHLNTDLIVGAHKKYYIIQRDPQTHLIGIKFKQGGMYHFYKHPLSQFSDRVANLSDVMKEEAEELRIVLSKTNDADEIRIKLNQFFLKRVETHSKCSDIVEFAVSNLRVNESTSTVRNLCVTSQISNKYMISLFNQKVGLSPKVIHRINKFIKVIDLLQAKKPKPWPEIAFECQYYDQAHLINEFKGFSGMSPKTYLDNEHANGLRISLF
ncbi:MAG: helix-turn-helix domain-containing protein [Bacteroidales bacterium]